MKSVEYLAGFFDGEGSIIFSGEQWEVCCCQTDENGDEALREMQHRWGGSLYLVASKNTKHSSVWRWKVRGIEAAIALTDMYLFLTVKQKRAGEALEYFAANPKISRILRRLMEPEPPIYNPSSVRGVLSEPAEVS